MPRKPSTEAPSSPKKKVSKAISKPKKALQHPKYEEMILKAIAHFHERGGSSVSAITKFIEGNYEVSKEHLKTQIRLGLKRAIEKNLLQKVKASYKISDGAKGKINKDLKGKKEKKKVKDLKPIKSKISKVVPKIATPSKKKVDSAVSTESRRSKRVENVAPPKKEKKNCWG